jgi:hypothetical protein
MRSKDIFKNSKSENRKKILDWEIAVARKLNIKIDLAVTNKILQTLHT